MSWQLSGRSLELCNCKMLCPCWLGPEGQPEQRRSLEAIFTGKNGGLLAPLCEQQGQPVVGSSPARVARRFRNAPSIRLKRLISIALPTRSP